MMATALSKASKLFQHQWPLIRSMASAASQKTCLYDFHVKNQGKMVDFAGYLLPIQYGSEGIAASHLHTR